MIELTRQVVLISATAILFWLIVLWACMGKKMKVVFARLALAYICAFLAYMAYTNKVFGNEAGTARTERWYQSKWCANKGRMEVVMADGTRCDCLTDTHAIEFEFGKKWAESIGQSLNYALQTNKRAGIVMIIGKDDWHYWIRLNSIITHFKLPIDTWNMVIGSKTANTE